MIHSIKQLSYSSQSPYQYLLCVPWLEIRTVLFTKKVVKGVSKQHILFALTVMVENRSYNHLNVGGE